MKKARMENWLYANEVCLACGHAVALNLMFETQSDHQRFLQYWDKYLGGMADLIQYHLAPTGWYLLFRTKSKQEIKEAYHKQRRKSKKAKRKSIISDVEKMISEHFRIFLSQYVRRTNAKHGRKGTLVLERFKKQVFKSGVDFIEVFNKMTDLIRDTTQLNRKYQADESRYDEAKEMKEISILKVGRRLKLKGRVSLDGVLGRIGKLNLNYVLRKTLIQTKIQKFPPPDS